MITRKNWQERMSQDMRLHDYSERTHGGYLAVTRQFFNWFPGAPRAVKDDDVRRYFLYLREERQLGESSVKIARYGLLFFFDRTMGRKLPVFDVLRTKDTQKLPVVLSIHEVHDFLGMVRQPLAATAFRTIYALGLRLGEALHLKASDVDSGRNLVWVRKGKGRKDRAIPLPKPLLRRLREFWKLHREETSSPYLFASPKGDNPLVGSTLQRTFKLAFAETHIDKSASPHTLRHSYATHLIEAGISLRTIQEVLGHSNLRTTTRYVHVTQPGNERLQATLDELMRDL